MEMGWNFEFSPVDIPGRKQTQKLVRACIMTESCDHGQIHSWYRSCWCALRMYWNDGRKYKRMRILSIGYVSGISFQQAFAFQIQPISIPAQSVLLMPKLIQPDNEGHHRPEDDNPGQYMFQFYQDHDRRIFLAVPFAPEKGE